MAVQSAQVWEYEIHDLSGRWGIGTVATQLSRLNELGAAGWELAAMSGTTGYFKRLVEQTDGEAAGG